MLKWVKKVVVLLFLIRPLVPLILYDVGNPEFTILYTDMLIWFALFGAVLYLSISRAKWTDRVLGHSIVIRLLVFGVLTRIFHLPNTLSLVGTFAPLVVSLSVLSEGRIYKRVELFLLLVILALSLNTMFRQNLILVILSIGIVYANKYRFVLFILALSTPLFLYFITNKVHKTRYGVDADIDGKVFYETFLSRMDPFMPYMFSIEVQSYPAMEKELFRAIAPSVLVEKKRVAPGQYFAMRLGNYGKVGGEQMSVALGVAGLLNIYTWRQRLILFSSTFLFLGLLRLKWIPLVIKYLIFAMLLIESIRGFESFVFGFTPVVLQLLALSVIFSTYEIIFNNWKGRTREFRTILQ